MMGELHRIFNSLFKWEKLTFRKSVKWGSYIIGVVILISLLIFISFPDPFINSFVRNQIIKGFEKGYPAYTIKLGDMHYNIWKNRLAFDSITLETRDLSFTCRVNSFSVSGIGWMKVLLHKDYTTNILTSSVIDAQETDLIFLKSQNYLGLQKLHISVPDSGMTVDSIKYSPLIHDEQFFAKDKFRQTRFRFDIPKLEIGGLDFLAFLRGNIYKAKSITLNGVFADILVNMDKPYDINSPNPKMPNEALSSMTEIIEVDSLRVNNGRLKYCERYAVRAKPGIITFNKVNVSVKGIKNHLVRPDTAIINGEGLFMNSGTMKLSMIIPLTSPDFSLRYSGSLSAMDLTNLNTFLEAGEHHRIKSGFLQSAVYNINVNSGHAIGTLRVIYKDLSIAILNKDTGSEKGIFNRIMSFFGKVFVIRGTNMPDEKGLMKIGIIKYTRNPDDYFLQFVWFALRNGVAEVVGFPSK